MTFLLQLAYYGEFSIYRLEFGGIGGGGGGGGIKTFEVRLAGFIRVSKP